MTTKKVIIQWEPPKDPDNPDIVYDNLAGYELHHNLPDEVSPLLFDGTSISTRAMDVPEGLYHVGIQTVSTEAHKSEKVLHSFEIVNALLNPEVIRNFNIPLGGVMSTNSSINSTAGIFRTESGTGWSFASSGTPQHYNSFQNGHANRYSQDCSDIEALTFSTMTDNEAEIKSHYILFDASDSDDPLKLVRWQDNVYATNNIGVGYWYDTDTGDTGVTSFPEATFIDRTGSVTVAASSNSVVGTSTLFTTEYQIDDIIYFNNQRAAKVVYINNNLSMTIDRTFSDATSTTSGNLKRQGLRIDVNHDALIYTVRKESGIFTARKLQLIIDESVFTRSRVATLQAAPTLLNFDEDEDLTTSYSNIVLTAVGTGFISPKFKITGAGFGNAEIEENAETSFSDPTSDNSYVKTLVGTSLSPTVETFSDTDLVFTVTITEAADESNTELQSTQTITIPFIKDGSAGGTGETGDDGKAVDIVFKRSTTVLTSAPTVAEVAASWYTDVGSVPALSNSLMYSSVGTKLPGATNYIWQVPIQIEGSDGSDGISIAELTIYLRSSSTPSTPSGGTYTFSSDTINSIPSGWTRNIPTGSSTPLWVSATVATVTGATGTSGTLTWSTPVLSMQDGTDGDTGAQSATGYLYHPLTATAPSAPTAGRIKWSDGVIDQVNNSWSITSPEITGGDTTQKIYSVYYSAIQADPDDTHTDLDYGNVTLSTNFVGLVKFDSANKIVDGNSNLLSFGQGGSTLIDGDVITTGVIKSNNYSGSTLDGSVYSAGGTLFDVDYGIIVGKQFKIDGSGNASFKGDLTAASGTFSGILAASSGYIGGWALDTGYIFNGTKHTTPGYSSSGITLNGNSNGSLHSPNFYINSDGTAGFKGTMRIGSTDLDATNTLNENTVGSDLGGGYGDSTIAGLTLASTKIYQGTGTWGGSTTGFYIDNNGNFSLQDKFKWDGTNLTIDGGGTFSGALNAASGSFTGTIVAQQIEGGNGNRLIEMGTDAQIIDNICVVLGATSTDSAAAGFIGTTVGVGGRCTNTSGDVGGVYGDNNGGNIGWLGHRLAGMYATSVRIGTLSDYYNLPVGDGDADQVLTTAGNGTVTWEDGGSGGGSGTITGVTAGTHLTGGGTSGTVTLNHLTTAGNKHIPTGGSSGQFLKYSSSGTAVWDAVPGGLELGTGSGNAYRADRALIAYDHSQTTHAPSNATTNTGTVTSVATGSGLTGGPITGSGTITHADTSSQASSNNAGRVGIQDITLDGFGHITGIEVATFSDTNTTYSSSDFNHNSLSGVSAAQHIDWTASSAGTIHSTNYTNTTYSGGSGMALSGTTFNIGSGTGISVTADQIALSFSGWNADSITEGSTNKFFTDAKVITAIAGAALAPATVTATGALQGSEVTATSDIRLKSNVKTIENALDKVSDMRGVTFNRAEGPSSGVIAQELEKVAPELVKDGEYKAVAYGNLVGYLIEAIKELKDKVEELENGQKL